MKHFVVCAIMMLPIVSMAQSSKITEAQSKQRIEKLAKLIQQYDSRFDYFNFIPDCDFVIFTNGEDNRQGIVDIDGKVLLPCNYYIFRQHGTSLFLVLNDSLMGLVDKDMRWAVPMEYDHHIDCPECMDMGSLFADGYACLPKNWLFGIVDTAGNVLVPFMFKYSFDVDMDNHLLYLIDPEEEFDYMYVTNFDGKKVLGPYQWIDHFSEGLAGFEKNDKYGFIDIKGNAVIPNSYDFTGWKFSNGRTLVTKDEKQMLIDKKGKVQHTFSASYDVLKPLWDYTAFVVKKYHDINFSLEGEYGIVDMNDKQIVPIRYDNCCIVNNKHIAMLHNDNSCDIYDKKGSLIASFQEVKDLIDNEEEVSTRNFDHFVVMKDSLWGIADSNFNIVLPCRYDSVEYLDQGLARVTNPDGSTSIIDMTGKVIVTGPYEYLFMITPELFKFLTFNPDNNEYMIVGFVDIYGNTTVTPEQTQQMKQWLGLQ